jgi:SAM-dependent methyltransferase
MCSTTPLSKTSQFSVTLIVDSIGIANSVSWLPEIRSGVNDEVILRQLRAFDADYQFRSLVSGHQYSRLYQLVRKYVPSEAEVLDWGAGSGHFSYFLVHSGYRATGYSLNDESFLSRLGDADYRFVLGNGGDPIKLPFAADSFDAVASIGVLEHVRETGGDEVGSLTEIHRILRPGGILLCYHFPNRYSWIDAVARLVPGAGHHRYRYTRRDVRELIRPSQFQLLESERYALLPRNPLARLPERIVDSDRVARAYDGVDRGLARLLSAACTNHYFVARKVPDAIASRPCGTCQAFRSSKRRHGSDTRRPST